MKAKKRNKRTTLDEIERYELSDEPGDQAMAIFFRSGLDWETFGLYIDHARETVQKRLAVMEQRLASDDYLLSVDTRMEYLMALVRHLVDGPATQRTDA